MFDLHDTDGCNASSFWYIIIIIPSLVTFVLALITMTGSLHVHHEEVDAAIFTMDGPLPATKVTLRCAACSTNYGYSKYGKKRSGGEKFYQECRDLIELSDVAYCSRGLSEAFTALW